MFTPRRLIIPSVLAVLVAGCGESTSTSSQASHSTATTATAATGANAGASGGTGTGGTTATTPAVTPTTANGGSKTSPQKTATSPSSTQTTTPHPTGSKAGGGKSTSKSEPFTEYISPKARYPQEVVSKFTKTCKAGGGSTAVCACIIRGQELRKVERGQSIAEMFALELAMKLHPGLSIKQLMNNAIRLPTGLERTLAICKTVRA